MNPVPPRQPTNAAAYQHLLSAALQARSAPTALSLVPGILTDSSVTQNETGLKLLALAFSIAASAPQPDMLPRARLPRRCCVLAYQPWFGIDFGRLVRAGLDREILLPIFAGMRAGTNVHVPGLRPANVREYCHKEFNLWSLCQYNLALSERSMPESLVVDEPKTFAAIKKIYAQAATLIDEALDFIDGYQPESVVVAQGHHLLGAVLRRVAIRRGVRTVSLENTFHRGKLLWEDVCGTAVNTTLAKNYFWRYRESVSELQSRETVSRYLDSIQSFKSSEHTSPATSATALPESANPLIVYLGQVSTDASILFGRRRFTSQIEAIRAVAEYALNRDVTVLVKLHPKEGPLHKVPEPFYRGLTSGWLARDRAFQRCVEQLGSRLIVDTENTYNTYDLIRRADACVTINSQAGLEALLFDREVILCGDAAYGSLGFTHESQDAVALQATLDRVLRDGLRCNDGVGCRKFFHIFTELYCLPKSEESFLSLAANQVSYPRLQSTAVDSSAAEVEHAA